MPAATRSPDTIDLEIPRDVASTYGRAALRWSRTRVVGVVAADGEAALDRHATIVLRPRLPSGPIRVRLSYYGTPPDIADTWWRTVPEIRDEVAQLDEWSVEREFRRRRELIEQAPRGTRTWHRFFCDLDEATFPPLLHERGRDDLAAVIERLGEHLFTRLTLRGVHARYGLALVGDPVEDERNRDDGASVARLLQPIFARHLGTDHAIDPGRLADALAEFVDGALLVDPGGSRGKVHGGPDGVAFLLFAELALYLCAIDPTLQPFWQPTVRPFVLAAEAFVHVHWNGGPRGMKSYTHSRPCRRFRRWRALQCSWKPDPTLAEADARFSALVAFALRDHLLARPMPGIFIAQAP